MIDQSRVQAGRLLVFAGAMLFALGGAPGQLLSGEADKPFQPPSSFASKQRDAAEQDRRARIEADHSYTLSELVDLAERYNPSTRAAWENTRAAAARLGIARSDLLPAVNAVALTNTTREGILFNDVFVQQTLGIFQPMLQLNYLIFDFGARSARIDEASTTTTRCEPHLQSYVSGRPLRDHCAGTTNSSTPSARGMRRRRTSTMRRPCERRWTPV